MSEIHCQHCAAWLRPVGIFDLLCGKPAGNYTVILTCLECGGETPITMWQGEVQTIDNPRTTTIRRDALVV